LRNVMSVFTLMNPAGSILGRRHRFRVRRNLHSDLSSAMERHSVVDGIEGTERMEVINRIPT